MKLFYLASEYPAISHTFILREITALRQSGFTVHTASIRQPAHLQSMPEEEQREHANTLYLKEQLLTRGGKAYLSYLRQKPTNALKMLINAFRWFVLAGPKSAPKAVAYVLEASLLLITMLEKQATHVHVHFANPAANVAMLAAATGEVQFSISAHGPDIFYDTRENLLALKAQQAAFIRCISHYCVSQFMRILPVGLWDKLHIVRCGVDTTLFAPINEDTVSEVPFANTPPAISAQQYLNKPTAPPDSEPPVRLLCLGRVCPAKAQPLLVDAFAALRKQGVNAHLTIIGGGEGLEELTHHVSRKGCEDSVTFTGPVGQDIARKAYDTADIFVLPSVAEGVPVVLMEAMAKEIPCIATNITGIPELIEHERTGLLATPGDRQSLADCINRLCTDAPLRKRLAQAGREYVCQHYDLYVNCNGMVRLFQENISE